MLLSARILKDVSSVNSFDYDTEHRFMQGNAETIYIQLTDLDKDRVKDGFKPSGRRYIPQTGATLTVTIRSIDDARTVQRQALQPFPGDPSIWQLQIMPTDRIAGACKMELALVEGGRTTRGETTKCLVAIIPGGI